MSGDEVGSLDLRARADEALDGGATVTADQGVPRERQIEIVYRAPGGQVLRATITSCIKGGKARLAVGRMVAGLLQGAAWESVPPYIRSRAEHLANFMFQVHEPPGWVVSAIEEDDELLFSIGEALGVHEAEYFRGHDPAGGEDPAKPRVVVRALDVAAGAGEPRAAHAA